MSNQCHWCNLIFSSARTLRDHNLGRRRKGTCPCARVQPLSTLKHRLVLKCPRCHWSAPRLSHYRAHFCQNLDLGACAPLGDAVVLDDSHDSISQYSDEAVGSLPRPHSACAAASQCRKAACNSIRDCEGTGPAARSLIVDGSVGNRSKADTAEHTSIAAAISDGVAHDNCAGQLPA